MKITDLAIVFIIIIIPFVLIANYQSSNMKAVAHERIILDQIIDTATMDSVASLVVGYNNNGYIIDKDEAITSFYETLYINFNILGDSVAQKRIQGYIPVSIIIDTDGFYALTNQSYINASGYTEVKPIWSEKKPYAYYDGNYIYMFTLTDELRIIDVATKDSYSGLREELKPLIGTTIIQDEDYFREVKQNTIINSLEEELEVAINHHNNIANQYGITYNFQLPKIEESDWANTISDIGILTFIQGVPLGATGEYYNSYALGGAGVIKLPSYYIQEDSVTGIPYYHCENCPELTNHTKVYSSRESCAKEGAHPCPICEP